MTPVTPPAGNIHTIVVIVLIAMAAVAFITVMLWAARQIDKMKEGLNDDDYDEDHFNTDEPWN